jgi:alkylated DNA repair protein alkB family protein 8
MTCLPFRREVFDSSICVAALHHVVSEKRRQKCIADIVEVLTPQHSSLLIQVWSFEQNLDPSNPYLKANPSQESQLPNVEIDPNIELPIHRNRTPFLNQDVLVPFHAKSKDPADESQTGPQLRYYHVFKENELDSMLSKIPNISTMQSYYDRGNWCAIIARQR